MKIINLKNIIKSAIVSLSIFLFTINNSFAATDNGLAGTLSFKEAANNVTNNVLTSATTLLMTAAFVVFFAGVVLFMYHRSTGDDTKLAKDREAMLWGLGALFVMVSVWGIIKLVQGFFGIQNDNNIQIQSVQFLAPASSGTTQSSATGLAAAGVGQSAVNKDFNTPATTTARPLVLPDTTPSKDVADLIDKYLNQYKCFPSGINSIGITYDSGKDSQYVQNFQKANGLTVDGKIGPDTWKAFDSGTAKSCQ